MFLPLDIDKIGTLFSTNLIIGFLLIGLFNALLILSVSYKFLQVIQQCGYNGKEYLKWLLRKDNMTFNGLTMLSLLSALGFMLINMALSFINDYWVAYTGFSAYILFLIFYFINEFKRKDKVPLVVTKRMIRLIVTFIIVTVLFSFLLIIGVNLLAIMFKRSLLANFRYAILCFCPMAVPFLILIAYYVNEPFERAVIAKYVNKCKEKLKASNNLIKIGITGSYGKTTVKEILRVILSEKYKVLATPQSYNTPLGITKTVKRLTGEEEVFIAEMGARRVGDIKKLTEIVNPDIAIITGVVCQHLETFNKIENIKKTKYEIIENMEQGKAVFSCDNVYTLEMYKTCKIPSVLAGVNVKKKPSVYATDIVTSENGTTFNLHIGETVVECVTSLLGKHNVSNICLASAVADILGLSAGEISSAISRLTPIKHRLELIKSNGLTILDDSYNANPEGIKCALEVLKEFKGNKYVVTPGIVELGFMENEKNLEFGKLLSKVASGVILVGRARTLKIREGLLLNNYPTDKIYMVKDLEEAKAKVSELASIGDVVLFENDLPDKYL